MTNDPNSIYTQAIVHSMGTGGRTGQVFEAARDNPRYPKTVLMACVLAGWMAAMASVRISEETG